MFAKSKQIGLVSLFVVLAAAIGGCAESVGNEPASFPSQQRSVAFSQRIVPLPPVTGDEYQVMKTDSLASRTDSKHNARPIADVHRLSRVRVSPYEDREVGERNKSASPDRVALPGTGRVPPVAVRTVSERMKSSG